VCGIPNLGILHRLLFIKFFAITPYLHVIDPIQNKEFCT
jgi:hypothetical protein